MYFNFKDMRREFLNHFGLMLLDIKNNPFYFQTQIFQVSRKFGLVSKNLPPTPGASSGVADSSGGPAYVFNGVYQPLACKLVQVVL